MPLISISLRLFGPPPPGRRGLVAPRSACRCPSSADALDVHLAGGLLAPAHRGFPSRRLGLRDFRPGAPGSPRQEPIPFHHGNLILEGKELALARLLAGLRSVYAHLPHVLDAHGVGPNRHMHSPEMFHPLYQEMRTWRGDG